MLFLFLSGYGEQNPAFGGRMTGNFPVPEGPPTPGPFVPGLTRNEGTIPGVGVAMPLSLDASNGEQQQPHALSMALGAPPLPLGPHPSLLAVNQQQQYQQNPQQMPQQQHQHQGHPQQMPPMPMAPPNMQHLQPPSHLPLLPHPHLHRPPPQMPPLGMPSSGPGSMPSSVPTSHSMPMVCLLFSQNFLLPYSRLIFISWIPPGILFYKLDILISRNREDCIRF